MSGPQEQGGHSRLRPRAYFEREEFILRLCGGKKVLHLGCVGMEFHSDAQRAEMFGQSLHRRLADVASELTGVDISIGAIEALHRIGLGMDIVYGDVERLEELDLASAGAFDVILAGDIIEHLSNPGRVLDQIARLAGPHSRLVITTPNAFGLPRMIRFVLGRFLENDEHTLSLNVENVRNLLMRHGFEVESLDTCYQSRSRRGGVGFRVGKALLRYAPRFGGTILVVARRSS
jgi:2-polyprenyl-3-methyl-5-hydroxy-6-metoxy-1,4-benzoquinol methylase